MKSYIIMEFLKVDPREAFNVRNAEMLRNLSYDDGAIVFIPINTFCLSKKWLELSTLFGEEVSPPNCFVFAQ